jgi:glucose-1-phosphate cytidylyltransferase
MKVVILCGGQGTRIRDANELLPKPLLPIGGKPILWHIMKHYAAAGHRDFVLCLGYRGWLIKEFFLNYRAMTSDLTVRLGDGAVTMHGAQGGDDWNVTLAETGEHTMTGGRLALVRKYLEGDEPFLLTYGDGVSDVDLGALAAHHRREKPIATVTAVRPPGRFGELRMSAGRVTEFNEKPQTSEGLINGGFFVVDGRRIWPYVAGGAQLIFEREPLRGLARDGELSAFTHEGFWQPMDTLREYTLLNDLWAAGKAPWKTWPEALP